MVCPAIIFSATQLLSDIVLIPWSAMIDP